MKNIDMAPWDVLLDAAGCVTMQAAEPIILGGRAYWHVPSGALERLAKCVDLLCENDGAMTRLKGIAKDRGHGKEASK